MNTSHATRWHFFIDRGGTFTDVVARTPGGTLAAAKILSSHPDYDDAAIEGIRRLMGVSQAADIPLADIAAVKMGTTVATNVLLERRGDPVVLVITAGLADQLEIGTQARPDIFAKRVVKPSLLYSRVIEACERVRADGTVERPLDRTRLEADLREAFAAGFRSVAIVLLHAYAHPAHERAAEDIARQLGFTHVSVSHRVSGLARIVPRGDTTVADAYLSPVLARYVNRVSAVLTPKASRPHTPRLLFMSSSGGLKAAAAFTGKDAVLSGPAGGIVAMIATAKAAGFGRVIGFDMGGTSTDVSHSSGAAEHTFETVVAGVRFAVPMLRITTVAAGGGSILSFDGTRLRVGPESAGADPGPMCYRRGGPLTVTDANVMLGRLQPHHFPAIFGPSGTEPLDRASVEAAFFALASEVGGGQTAASVAAGFLEVAAQNMASAIRTVSVARGYDVSTYTLACFGSAGGQHACAVAAELGMEAVFIHPLSGLLSAYGMGLAGLTATRTQSIEQPLNSHTLALAREAAAAMASEAGNELAAQGVDAAGVAVATSAHIRYSGADTALPIPLTDDPAAMRADFEARHARQFGYLSPEKAIELAALEVMATGGGEPLAEPECALAPADSIAPGGSAGLYADGGWHDAGVYLRETLRPGHRLAGPALVIEPHQTVVVEPGWLLTVTARNHMVMKRIALPRGARPPARATDAPDPALLEVMNNRFMGIAEQMGEALRATAQSVNIKERLDFSCAVFDSSGALVANAPHLPVHLASMDRSVETVVRERARTLNPGDSAMLNAPYNGGTHLPDITVVTPVFGENAGEILFYVASRGHHEDIGGLTPGSMTPRATRIEEEGVYIDNVLLVEQGRFLEDETRALLLGAPYPARQPDKNIADLKAQVSANARGAAELLALVEAYGLATVRAYMGHIQDAAESAVRRLISRLDDGRCRVETDSGAAIEVSITVDRQTRSAKVDFTGTSPQQADNFNAPEPVTRAAVLYVFRVLVDEAIPMNAGCLRSIQIVIPDGSMLSPRYPAAVVAGNTETSQIVTNALFAALGALGTAQGTMNNLTFGNGKLQYYETICSGAPAGPGFDGAAGVHVHMTNTRLTDPEILELRYPVLVERFAIRRGSGGRGRWRSGDGTERIIRFLEPLKGAILSGGRRVAPRGVAGGLPGQTGANRLERADGTIEDLGSCAEFTVGPGDRIVIVTPTGGGYGAQAETPDRTRAITTKS